MLRDKNLIPLSHQHQHALALCVRITRSIDAGKADVKAWQLEIEQHFAQEIQFHFQAEEEILFRAAQKLADLTSLVNELVAEHGRLRDFFACAAQRQLDLTSVGDFAELLSGHIRKEERQLFEAMQKNLTSDEMSDLGRRLDESLERASKSCALPKASR